MSVFSKGSSKKGGDSVQMPFIELLQTYVAYAGLLVVAYIYDGIFHPISRYLFKSKGAFEAPRPGYAPLLKDFEYFYTRYFYGPIRDCWDRRITSGANTWIDVAERVGVNNNEYFEYTGKSTPCLNLGSYNYLGFGEYNGPTVPQVCETVDKFGISTCSTRLDYGTTALHRELEKEFAKFLNKEDAIIFGMGYQTNSTVIPTLVGRGGLIISDSLNHASLVVGCRSTGAKITIFKHNDPASLEKTLRKAIADGQPRTHKPWNKILIVVEGIYSMEGEILRLKEIVEIKKKYKAYLYVDEAHSIGAIGKTGRGVCEYSGVDTRDIDILMGTFTKSFASVGGYITGSKDFITYLRNTSFGSLYDTSMSAPAVMQALAALNVMTTTADGKERTQSLYDNAVYFRKRLNELGFLLLGNHDSPVVPVIIGSPHKLSAFSRECLRRNLAVVVVGFPATPLVSSRARFCLSAKHTREEIDRAVAVIEEVGTLCMMRWYVNTEQHDSERKESGAKR